MLDKPFKISVPYPEVILMETTNHCNYSCLMCPQGLGLVKNKGYMDFSLFKKVIDQVIIQENKPRIGLHISGEPLLHSEIVRFVRYATSHGLYVFFHTNGSLLNLNLGKQLVEAKLNEITFSFEGEDAEWYETIRVNGNWGNVLNNIQKFAQISLNTKIIIEILKFRGRDQLSIDPIFKAKFSEFPNISFKSYFASDWHGTFDNLELKEDSIKSEEPGLCQGVFKILSVAWDGKVKACGIDYNTEVCLGDLNEESISQVWEGKRRMDFLNLIEQKAYNKISICANCGSPYTQNTKKRNVE